MTTPYLTPPVFSWPATPGGKLHTYLAGGTIPQATYSDAAGATPNANPVTLDTLGSAVVRLAIGVAYHFVLKDALDVATIWDADNIDNNYLSTAAGVGAVLYPLTAAESAASVTPTAYQFIPGDLRRYGAVVAGDITTAWSNALLQAQQVGGAAVYFPAALGSACTMSAGVTLTAPVVIFGDGSSKCAVTATADITILSMPLAASGSKVSGIQFVGIGVGATLPGILLTNNNQTIFTGVRASKFGTGFRLAQGANASYLISFLNCRSESNNLYNFDLQRLSNGTKLIDCTFGGTANGAPVTAVTRAASAVLTISTASAVNPFSINQYVRIAGLGGMTQMNGLTPQVTAIGGASGAWTVTVNHNSTNYTAYTAGGTLASASWGVRCVDSNFLTIQGGDCEGLALGCYDIDSIGGGTFGNCGHVISGVDQESSSSLFGDVRIGQTNVVNGVTLVGGYTNPTFADVNGASNPSIGANCGMTIGPGGCNGLTVIGHEISSGYFGQTEFVTGITQAASGVVTISSTAVANPYQVGQNARFDNVGGMVQVNGNTYLITAIGGVSGAWTFTINVNTSGFGVYTTGGISTVNCGYLRLNGPLTNERILLGGPFAGQYSQYISETGKINYADRPGLSLDAPTFLFPNQLDWTHWNYYKINSNNFAAGKEFAAGIDGLRVEFLNSTGTGTGWARRCIASGDGTSGCNARALQVVGAFDQTEINIPYTSGVAMAWRASNGNLYTLTITDGVAWTIGIPVNIVKGQVMSLTVRNTSGGPLGAATFNAAFKMSAWVNPATGFNRTITWKYDGGNWIEQSRTPNDVPN